MKKGTGERVGHPSPIFFVPPHGAGLVSVVVCSVESPATGEEVNKKSSLQARDLVVSATRFGSG